MKRIYLPLIFLALAVQCFAQNPIPKWQPGTILKFFYTAFTCPSIDNGATCVQGAPTTPVKDVWVTMFISPTTGSGFHTHETTQTNRPTTSFITPARIQTAANGEAEWSIIASNWAGEYNVIMIPEDKGSLHFPGYTTKYYVGVTISDKLGNPHTFGKFRKGPYSSEAPTDIRHRDGAGNAIYNTWGADSCMTSLSIIGFNYYSSVYNAGRFKMAPWRMSTPDGGNADNEVDVATNYLFGEWMGRAAEWHPGGRSVDVVNPKLYADQNNIPSMFVQFTSLRAIMYKGGWRLGKTTQFGDTLGGKDQETNYWYNQPINHYVCGSEPLLTP